MRRRFDLLVAAATAVVVTIFFVWQFFLIQRAAEARLSGRAMHLQVDIAGATLFILNRDSAFFRGCSAIVNRDYRSGRQFVLPPAEHAADPVIRLSLAEFSTDERLLDWHRHPPTRLEVHCDQYAEVASDSDGITGVVNPDALSWAEERARWVGRL